MREVLARQTRREGLTSRGDVGNIGSQPIEEMRKHEEPESIRIKALMLAYASAVWAAYKEADDANTLFWVNLSGLASAQIETQLRAEQESAGVSEGSLRQEVDYQGALDAMHNSRKDAVVVNEALFNAINQELAWAPQRVPASTDLAGLRVFRRA